MQFELDPKLNYKIALSNLMQTIGSLPPGLYTSGQNMQFSTYDADHDTANGNCSGLYSNTPWWYGSCWSGSINGGGESSGQGIFNGAYWFGAVPQWGDNTGNGAGNGWLFVR